jgi:hypothetical protein
MASGLRLLLHSLRDGGKNKVWHIRSVLGRFTEIAQESAKNIPDFLTVQDV